MPYTKRIADLEQSIDELQTVIADHRRNKVGGSQHLTHFLAELAKLKARRVQCKMRQRLFLKNQTLRAAENLVVRRC